MYGLHSEHLTTHFQSKEILDQRSLSHPENLLFVAIRLEEGMNPVVEQVYGDPYEITTRSLDRHLFWGFVFLSLLLLLLSFG